MYIVQFIQAYSCPEINLKPISQSPSNSISLLLSSCLLAHFHAGWEVTRPGCMPGRALKPYRAVLLWIMLTEFWKCPDRGEGGGGGKAPTQLKIMTSELKAIVHQGDFPKWETDRHYHSNTAAVVPTVETMTSFLSTKDYILCDKTPKLQMWDQGGVEFLGKGHWWAFWAFGGSRRWRRWGH